jgi:hypothetical protein
MCTDGVLYAYSLLFLCSVAILDNFQVFITYWHHWSAFIGPSEMVQAGARLLYDIPAQYGVGPTMVLFWACRPDCWGGAYWVFTISATVFALLVGALVWTYKTGQVVRGLLLLIACIAACIFWVSYPPAVGSPMATPSTSGMRFLPAILLTSWIIFICPRKKYWQSIVGHALWILGLLWSPEAAFYATLIWCPIYLFDQVKNESFHALIISLLKAVGQLISIAVIVILIIISWFKVANGVFPDYRYYVAYAIAPPGVLPIDSHGAVWFFIFSLCLSISAMWSTWMRTRDKIRLRKSVSIQLLGYAAFSIILGVVMIIIFLI